MFFNDVNNMCKCNVKIQFKSFAVEKHCNVNVTNDFTNAVTVVFENGSAIIYPMDNITKVEVCPMR